MDGPCTPLPGPLRATPTFATSAPLPAKKRQCEVANTMPPQGQLGVAHMEPLLVRVTVAAGQGIPA